MAIRLEAAAEAAAAAAAEAEVAALDAARDQIAFLGKAVGVLAQDLAGTSRLFGKQFQDSAETLSLIEHSVIMTTFSGRSSRRYLTMPDVEKVADR